MLDSFEECECPDPNGVLVRLDELQTPLLVLRELLRRGYLAGDFCTVAHARTYRGLRVYHEANGELRGQLAARAWTMSDEENIPRIIRPDGLVVLTIVSGNAQTGIREGENAQARRPRGEAGIRLVRQNSQIVLAELLPEGDPELQETVIVSGHTWFLLHNRVGDTIRSELSLAHGITEDGGLLIWAERLILPEFELYEGESTTVTNPDGGPDPDLDVPVTRRNA